MVLGFILHYPSDYLLAFLSCSLVFLHSHRPGIWSVGCSPSGAVSGSLLASKSVEDLPQFLSCCAYWTDGLFQKLNLERCGIGDIGGALIGEVLEENCSITDIDLSWNMFRKKTAQAFYTGLRSNPALVNLGMSNSGLSDQDCGMLLHGFHQHGRTFLKLQHWALCDAVYRCSIT